MPQVILDALQMKGLPIVSVEEGVVIGRVSELVIHPATLEFVALKVKAGLFGGEKLIVVHDIEDIGHDLLFVRNSDALSEPDEIVRVYEVLKLGIVLIGSPVVTESGQRIGTVKDFTCSLTDRRLLELAVKSAFQKSPLRADIAVAAEQIVAITREAVIVRDEIIKEAETAIAAVPVTG